MKRKRQETQMCNQISPGKGRPKYDWIGQDGQGWPWMARIFWAFSNSNSAGAPSLWGFDLQQWGFNFELLLQLVALQTPAPEQYTNEAFRNGFCIAFWRGIYDDRRRGHVVSVYKEGVFESWVCSFPLPHFTC